MYVYRNIQLQICIYIYYIWFLCIRRKTKFVGDEFINSACFLRDFYLIDLGLPRNTTSDGQAAQAHCLGLPKVTKRNNAAQRFLWFLFKVILCSAMKGSHVIHLWIIWRCILQMDNQTFGVLEDTSSPAACQVTFSVNSDTQSLVPGFVGIGIWSVPVPYIYISNECICRYEGVAGRYACMYLR